MKKNNIELSKKDKLESVKILHKLLADEFVLYTKTRKYHWNVTGLNFKTLHQLFEEEYRDLEQKIDAIAERVRSLGFLAIGSLKQFGQLTQLEESEHDVSDSKLMLIDLLKDHETIIRGLRVDISRVEHDYYDIGTIGFLTSILESHENMAWMLRATLE